MGNTKAISDESTSESDIDATIPSTQLSDTGSDTKVAHHPCCHRLLPARYTFTGQIVKMTKMIMFYAAFASGMNQTFDMTFWVDLMYVLLFTWQYKCEQC